MAKQSGLGDNFYIGGYDLSGDVNALSKIEGKVAVLDVTAINKSAMERLPGERDGDMTFTTLFDNGTALTVFGNEHQILSTLPTTDTIASYWRGTTLGGSAACLNAKQINYDGKRDAKGNLTLDVDCQGNAYGLEWGVALTPGIRTDTTATNGTSVDFLAGNTFGAQMYAQVFSVTGTSVTITVQHSTDNSTWSTLAAFAAVNAGSRSFQRVTVANNSTVNRYLRAITTGTFSNAQFAVMINVNNVANVVF